jgi:hypothetical protein
MYNTSTQFEFYRNRHELEFPSEMRALTRMPGSYAPWFGAALARMGDLFIATGTKLKKLARPSVVFSQETL